MIDLEFLEKYPLATEMITDWFHQRMIESFKDPEIAEEFKEFVLEQGMELDKLAVLINSNPRMLFDVFDENEVFIFSHYMDVKDNVEFFHSFRNIDTNPVKLFKTRKEAELFAIEKAFEILEDKLKPIDLPKLEEN